MQSDDGTISRNDLLKILANHGVDVTDQDGGFGGIKELKKGEVVDARRIPDRVSKKMLRYLGRTFDIAIHQFYE